MTDKIFYNVYSASTYLGLSIRRVRAISVRLGIDPHNFGGRGVRSRFMWTHDQVQKIKQLRIQEESRKEHAKRNR